MKSDLNSHILEAINSAIEEKILPSIENVITSNREAKSTKWDLRSDGRHPIRNAQIVQNLDHESHGRHKDKSSRKVQDSENQFPKLIATSSNQDHHRRESLVDSDHSDDDGYDIRSRTWQEKSSVFNNKTFFMSYSGAGHKLSACRYNKY